MNWFTRLKTAIGFSMRYDIAYPLRGRLQVARARRLLRRGLRGLEAGIALARRFDDTIEGGLRKRAHQMRRSEAWNDYAAEIVAWARELRVKLHGPEPEPKVVPGSAFAGITARAGVGRRRLRRRAGR